MSNFKGFSKKVEQATIKHHQQKLFNQILEETGDIEMARQILKDRPYAQYVPSVGTLLTADPNADTDKLLDIAIHIEV